MSQTPVFNIIKKNIPRSLARDVYHDLLTMNWWKAIMLFIGLFLFLNAFYATLYYISPGSLSEGGGTWESCFFFSVQTLATIGYGTISPLSQYGNILVTIESMTGLIFMAIMTGFFFSKFAQPHSKIEFTKNVVITRFEGKPTLMFRMINLRQNQMVDSTVHVVLLKQVVTAEGMPMRKFYDLKLTRSRIPLFALSMNIMHVIDDQSPLYSMDMDNCPECEIVVTTIGTDGTFGQTIHAIHRYTAKEIIWNHKFKDMVEVLHDGTRVVDFANFDVLEIQ